MDDHTSKTDTKLDIEKCTIVVSSCDAYSDLWEPYFNLKEKFWPDCDFRTVLISESKKTDIKNVDIYNTGKDLTWSKMLINTIRYTKSDYILLTMEDFFLQSAVDNSRVVGMLNYIIDNDIDMLRLIPRPGPNLNLDVNNNIGDISIGTGYRVSGQAAFWKSSVLLDLLDESESLWDFEVNATVRSHKYSKFKSVIDPVLTYKHHVIERGKWFPWSAWIFNRMNIGVDLESRKVMSVKETSYWIFSKIFLPYWVYLPMGFRIFIKRITNK